MCRLVGRNSGTHAWGTVVFAVWPCNLNLTACFCFIKWNMQVWGWSGIAQDYKGEPKHLSEGSGEVWAVKAKAASHTAPETGLRSTAGPTGQAERLLPPFPILSDLALCV